jgi:hypothetical protein
MSEAVAAASTISTPPAELTREQALARHQQIMADPTMEDWRAAFAKGDIAKREEFAALHRVIEKLDPEDLPATQEARAKLEREKVVDHLRSTADIPDPVADMIRNDTPVSAQERRLAEQERGKLMTDPDFVKQWLSGQRAARTRMTLVDVILARPVIRAPAK